MSGLLTLADELLCLILSHVAPNDIDNFLLSCKRTCGIASKRFVNDHAWLKYHLRTIDNCTAMSTTCTTPKLLELILDENCKADYVKAMVVRPWRVQWSKSLRRYRYPRMHSSKRMQVFQEEIELNKLIPSREKACWIRSMRAGYETPIIALIFLRLHHLTSIVIALGDLEDRFMIKALLYIAKHPQSSSLAGLRHAEIRRTSRDSSYRRRDLQYLLACAALPSIVSIEGYDLLDTSPEEESIKLLPQSISLTHLKLECCAFRPRTLENLIRSARSLRSFTFTHGIWHRQVIDPPYAWICRMLADSASSTLEKLVLEYCQHPDLGFRFGNQLNLSNFTHVRTLNIDFWSLLGPTFPATDGMPTLLPASLETLVISDFFIDSYEWFRQFVERIAKAKANLLPRLTELTLVGAYTKASQHIDSSVLQTVYAIGANAGISTTARFYHTREASLAGCG